VLAEVLSRLPLFLRPEAGADGKKDIAPRVTASS
jgi:hypothetical protein